VKILILNSEFPPVGAGAGNASAHIARLLAEGGNDVAVVTTAFGSLPPHEILDGVRVFRGPARRARRDRSTALEQISFIAGATYRCIRLRSDLNPDVVLAFFGLPSGAVGWMLKRLFAFPYVVSLRGGDVPGFRPYDFWLYHKIAVPFLRTIWHDASAVVANSEGLRTLARAFDPSVEITIIPNGVDTAQFARAGREKAVPRILSVGRIVHQKGLDLAAQALAGLQDLVWDWHVIGDGPQLQNLRDLVHKLGFASRSTFGGWKGASDLQAEYQDASIFLFPSRHEGMPNAVLEAMASGLPVVASSISGNEELVIHQETGLLVPPEDPAALREALRKLVLNAKLRGQFGEAGRDRVKRLYGWSRVARQYSALLERASS
jgi:glycosyltransferase involved in cell wall biosynthesis